ncbi:hypothetical protein EH196_01210 [Bacillus sp. C1-1]|nr:hypothetical protein EH196_01210 [Bacillus sp. C1-1]
MINLINARFSIIIDRVSHLGYCDVVFTGIIEEFRGERDAIEMRSILIDYIKNFFGHYMLHDDTNVENV